jgi:hypothetical protein
MTWLWVAIYLTVCEIGCRLADALERRQAYTDLKQEDAP